jgi:hypothetical protein
MVSTISRPFLWSQIGSFTHGCYQLCYQSGYNSAVFGGGNPTADWPPLMRSNPAGAAGKFTSWEMASCRPGDLHPVSFGVLPLNFHVRFRRPGTYTCEASSAEVTAAPRGEKIRSALLVKSNPISLAIASRSSQRPDAGNLLQPLAARLGAGVTGTVTSSFCLRAGFAVLRVPGVSRRAEVLRRNRHIRRRRHHQSHCKVSEAFVETP